MDGKVSFLAFCNLCEHLSRLHKIEQKKQKLCGFIEEWRKEDPRTIYSFIRLLLPHLDSERDSYGLKELKLAEMYTSALALPRDSHDSHCLRNWQQSRHKDFADALFEVLKRRLGEDDGTEPVNKKLKLNSISLKDVNDILDQLTLSGDDRRDLFLKLTAKMSAKEQKWLTRIILKCLRVGLPDGQVLKLIHLDAPDIFNVRMNLSEVVKIFTAADSGAYCKEDHLKVKLFSPFRPMLAEREALEKAASLLAGPFFIEPKLDGERCQLHYSASEGLFKYFSRQGIEYTYLYGQDEFEGSLSPKIALEHPFPVSLDSVVLDGEMVVYDPLIDKFLPFGSLKTSAGARYDPGRSLDEPHPCLVVFDVVYWNGQSLLNWSLSERIRLLKNEILTSPIKGFLEIIERSELKTSTADITTALDTTIQEQGEGLILKDPHSLYVPSHRSSHWIKIKPEYVGGMCSDLDLVVMGAWYGRAGNIKNAYGKASEFLCGVWTEDGRVVPFVKVGSGYNSHEWSTINQHLEPLLIKPTPSSPIISELKGSDRPDLIVRDPHQSIVIQVKGSQIVASGAYKTLGHTLRFPRFIKLRLDRAAGSSLKASELMRLKDITAGTLVNQSAVESVEGPARKRQGARAKGKMVAAIERTLATQKIPGNDPVQDNANLSVSSTDRLPLAGYEILVINGSDTVDKFVLEHKATALGAKTVQSPPVHLPSTRFLAIAGKDCGVRVKNLRALGTVDILKGEWLLECGKLNRLVPFKTSDFVYVTDATLSLIQSRCPPPIHSNHELKEILSNEISVDQSDPQAIADICNEFIKFGIEVPRGYGQIIPITRSTGSNVVLNHLQDKFTALKLEYKRSKWI